MKSISVRDRNVCRYHCCYYNVTVQIKKIKNFSVNCYKLVIPIARNAQLITYHLLGVTMIAQFCRADHQLW